MMLKNLKFGLILLVFGAVTMQSCKDEVDPVNEEEVINEIKITLKDDNNQTYNLSYIDSDGAGPTVPVIMADVLPSNKKLTGYVTFENTLNTPVDKITDEILDEGTDHQLFFTFKGSPAPVVVYKDQDSNGKPIGLQIEINTLGQYFGIMDFVLRHQPNKDASGVSAGEIVNAGGTTDVQITFNVTVE